MGRVEGKSWPGRGTGAAGVYLSLGFGGLGEPESGEKTRSLFRRGAALRLMGRVGPWGGWVWGHASLGLGGPWVRSPLRRGLKELRRGDWICCSATLWRG